MKLEPKKYFTINIDTFCVDIAFFINYSPGEVVEFAKKKKNKYLYNLVKHLEDGDFNSSGVKAQMYPLERGYLVLLKSYKNSFRINLTYAMHEISHLVSWILLDRRIPLTKDSDEVYAYLTEEITKKYLFKLY